MKKDSSLSRSENLTFRTLYLIAIVLVVDGHTTLDDMFGMGDLFRYYSFHLLLFAFGAGYFFKFHGGVLSDLAARAKRLLVPLYIWNVVYGIGAAALRRFGGFEENGQKLPHLFEENRKEDASFCLKKGFGYTIIRLYV